MTETIEIQEQSQNGQWKPFVGEETMELLKAKGFINADGSLNESGDRVLNEAYKVMQACGNPNEVAISETGIVIGYVQSGKTLSFTTLTALARDNSYQLVIVIAGTTTPLVNQSTERLRSDLRLNQRYDWKWTLLKNPSQLEDGDLIEMYLQQWADRDFPDDRCRTVLITVMKNGHHLGNLTSILTGLSLEGVPTLIIDDEGDQASLNTRARWASRAGIDIEDLTENQVSTIYRRINRLRLIFPHHTFLQYTATPQANLFINIMDRLSPNFIKLLTPGDEYTGGTEFFGENSHLIKEIPISQIPTNQSPLSGPPESLLYALKIFYLGVVVGTQLEQFRHPGQRNRSMLVHPSRLRDDHNTFYGWINQIKGSWERLLSGPDNDEKTELLNEFREAYNDLHLTVGDELPSFDQLINRDLAHAIAFTPIVEVNSRRGTTPQINWQDNYSWILVGGQSMDRGFTVEGLTITYMPRNIGVGNVDTVQQRARFFGYKRSYLNYCRVYLDPMTIDAYQEIIEHEEHVRSQLEEFDLNNRHLNDFVRETVLNRMLRLTRANILYDDLDRDRFEGWFTINAPHDMDSLIDQNRETLFDFLGEREEYFSESEGHPDRTSEQKHLAARFTISDCLEHLLNKLKFTRDSDSASYSSLRGILQSHIEEKPEEECLIYLMSARSLMDWTRRIRRLRNDEIQQLFQGKQPTRATQQYEFGEVYPGDREIKDENMLTIQVHLLNIRDEDYTDVPTLAIWIPDHISKDIIRKASN